MKVGGADSMEMFTPIFETSQICLSDGRRPVKDVLGNHLKGPIIPFGSLVEYYPITAKDQSRIHQFGRTVYLDSSSEGIWKGWRTDGRPWGVGNDGTHRKIYSKRLNAKEVIFPKEGEFIFSNRRWTNQNSRRRSGTENIHLGTAATKSRRGSHWLSWRIRRISSPPHDSFPDAGEAINDFWSMSGSFIYGPSRWTQSRTLLAERRIIPYSHWNTLT